MAFRLLLMLICFNALGANYYVATNGNDAASGDIDAPWLTIQQALNSVVSGDTVNITAGAYADNAVTKNDGTQPSPITIQCSGIVTNTGLFVLTNSWYIIRGFSFYSNWMYLSNVTATHNIIESNIVERSHAISIAGVYPQYTNGPSFNTIRFNLFTNLAYFVASCGIGGFNNTIESNIWWTGNDNDAINFFGTSNIFNANLFVDISPSGEHTGNHIDMFQTFGDAFQECHYTTIENNIMSNCAGHFFIANSLTANPSGNTNNNEAVSDILVRNNVIIRSVGDSFLHSPRIQFVNNTFYGCGGISGVPQIWVRDISYYGAPSNCVVINNIIAESTANAPLSVDATFTNQITCGYNFVSRTGGASQASLFGINNINGGDAGFVSTNSSSINLQLQMTSVCINAGTNSLLAATDILGRTRSPNYDIGAYEYYPSAPPQRYRWIPTIP